MNTLLQMYPGDACVFLVANVLVQVTVVILTARLLARLGSRWNAAWRHSIYLVALLCVLASPVLSWMVQATGMTLVTLRPSVPDATPAAPALLPLAHSPAPRLIEPPAPPRVGASTVHREAINIEHGLRPESPSGMSFPDILRALGGGAVVIWLLGMALLLARWCYGLRLIAVLRRAAQPLDGEALAELLGPVRRALGADRLPPMATSASLDRPIMVGMLRPLVILPENVLRSLHQPDLADVLVHECAHAVCRHQVVGLLQRVAATVFWPHPLVRLLNRELARAREEVCDNYVLRRSNAPRYARTLLELSELLVGVSPKPAALGLFHCHWRLEDRVADLLDRRRKVMIRVNRWTIAALTATFLLLALLMAGTRVVQAEPAADEAVPPGTKVIEKTIEKTTEKTVEKTIEKTVAKPSAEKTATPAVTKGKGRSSVLSAAEKEDIKQWRGKNWRLRINLDMPELDPPVVQYSYLDHDPTSEFIAQVKTMRGFNRMQLEKAIGETRKEQVRGIQMLVSWDFGFRKVTGDRLWLLTTRPRGSFGLSSNGPAGKKWIVTKTVHVKGKPVCWCIPIEVKTGHGVEVTLNAGNTFDLKTLYDKAMRETAGSDDKKQLRGKGVSDENSSDKPAKSVYLGGSLFCPPRHSPSLTRGIPLPMTN